MTSFQKIAMGLVIVTVDAFFFGYDAVPDVLGWVLVLLGVRDLRRTLSNAGTLLGVAAAAGTVSAALVWPDVLDALSESSQWLLSLPQVVFSFLLCTSVAELLTPERADLVRRFRLLRWVFAVTGAGPVLLYGGDVRVLLVPLAVLTVLANVYLIYLLFRVPRPAAPEPEVTGTA